MSYVPGALLRGAGVSLEPTWKAIVEEILPRIWAREASGWERAITHGQRIGLSAGAIAKIQADAEWDQTGLALAQQKLAKLLAGGQLGIPGQHDVSDIAAAMKALGEKRCPPANGG